MGAINRLLRAGWVGNVREQHGGAKQQRGRLHKAERKITDGKLPERGRRHVSSGGDGGGER